MIIDLKRTQYGLYQDAVNLCKSGNEEKWKEAKFMVFDSPLMYDKTYEVREVSCLK